MSDQGENGGQLGVLSSGDIELEADDEQHGLAAQATSGLQTDLR